MPRWKGINAMTSDIWLITGVSSGLGKAIAHAALEAGDTVVGTLRKTEDRIAFEALKPGRAHGVLLDVTDEAAVAPEVTRIEREIGPISVLVNNAGYGHEGLVEESSLDEMRRQFEVNVFGATAMIKAVLPGMRARRSGRIINITSMGGLITFPGLGIYHASKFALEGLSEALGKEVIGLGIRVTAVEPGAFRTDWAGRSMVRAPRSISDYDALMDPIRQRRASVSGSQIGDPTKAATAIVGLAKSEHPPVHLLLGSDAWQFVDEKLERLRAELQEWKSVTLSTDFAN